MINVLSNNRSPEYLELKKIVLAENFPWNYQDSGTGMPFYCHSFLTRPEGKYSEVCSQFTELAAYVISDLLEQNKLATNYFFLRSAANCVHPDSDIQLSEPHVDHDFPHINMLVYLTNAGGKTYCEGVEHDPKEDDVVVFNGEHFMERPTKGRRIILVNTLYTY